MPNPLVQGLVFIAAVLIPGGLLVYAAWHALKRRKAFSSKVKSRPTPEEAREAFMKMYPEESLRAQNRRKRLDRALKYRRRTSQN